MTITVAGERATKLTMDFNYKGADIDSILLAVSSVAEVFIMDASPYRITASSAFIADLFDAENKTKLDPYKRYGVQLAILDLPHGGGSYRIDVADGIEYGTVIMEKD